MIYTYCQEARIDSLDVNSLTQRNPVGLDFKATWTWVIFDMDHLRD